MTFTRKRQVVIKKTALYLFVSLISFVFPVLTLAGNLNLFDTLGLTFNQKATTPGQTMYAYYSKHNDSSFQSKTTVNPGVEQRLYIDIPYGVVSGGFFKTHKDDTYAGTAVIAATQSGETAQITKSTSFGKNDGGSIYSGKAVKSGDKTMGLVAVRTSGGSYVYVSMSLNFTLGSSQEDVDNFNAWLESRGGISVGAPSTTSGYTPPSTSSAPSTSTTPSTSTSSSSSTSGGAFGCGSSDCGTVPSTSSTSSTSSSSTSSGTPSTSSSSSACNAITALVSGCTVDTNSSKKTDSTDSNDGSSTSGNLPSTTNNEPSTNNDSSKEDTDTGTKTSEPCNAITAMVSGCTPATSTDNQEEEESEFKGQNYTSGKNAVLERLIILFFKNNGTILEKVPGLTINENDFQVQVSTEEVLKFLIDMSKIPETMADIDESSVNIGVVPVDGLSNTMTIELLFSHNSENVTLGLHPVVHQKDDFVKSISSIGGIFKVLPSDDGWVVIVMESGDSFSLYFDFKLKVQSATRSSTAISFDTPVNNGYHSNDVNGDGIDDYMVVHPDGTIQLMLLKL